MYDFYLTDNTGQVIELPISPSAIETSINGKNETVELINGEEINLIKAPNLTDIKFDFIIPAYQYPFAKQFQQQSVYLTFLEDNFVNKRPVILTIYRKNGTGNRFFDFSMTVSIENYTIKDDADNGFDMVVAVSFKQYKQRGTIFAKVEQEERPKKETFTQYTIQEGDTLWLIAKKMLGSGDKWQILYEYNKDILDAEAKKHGRSDSGGGNYIYAGTVITIPNSTDVANYNPPKSKNTGSSNPSPIITTTKEEKTLLDGQKIVYNIYPTGAVNEKGLSISLDYTNNRGNKRTLTKLEKNQSGYFNDATIGSIVTMNVNVPREARWGNPKITAQGGNTIVRKLSSNEWRVVITLPKKSLPEIRILIQFEYQY